MTEVNPAGFLQNAGTTHTAEIMRGAFNMLGAGTVSGTMAPRAGVSPTLGSKLAVQQNGTPNMSVNVLSGHVFITGSEALKQGIYSCLNDATVNKTIAASDPTNPRIDLVVAKVQDAFYSGGTNAWSLAVVTGTPAGSPSPPAAPANSVVLAHVAVAAGVTSIVNANITDKRPWFTATGGLVPVRDKAERDAIFSPNDGLSVWRQDLDGINIYNGANWLYHTRPTHSSVTTTESTTSTSYVDLATSGPAVTIETDTVVRISLMMTSRNTATFQSRMSFAVSGATTTAASDFRSIFHPLTNQARFGGTFNITGLTPGSNTFTAKYRVDGGSGEFENRILIAEAC